MTRILVIEDNEANRQLLNYLLQAFGYEVLMATDGEEGLEAAQRERPDLILCDVHLPKLDGYEIARRLKSTPGLSAIPLIAVTALAMVGDRDKILTAGFEGYIAKPMNPETIIAQMEAFLQPGQRVAGLPESSSSVATTEVSSRLPSRAALLVVDNLPVNLALMVSTFEPFGYTVIPVQEVQQALELARQTPPDLIFSDLHMPGEDGRSFLKAVKADPQLRHIPFIIISSSAPSRQELQSLRALGAQEVISRPVEPEQLLALVEVHLKNRHRPQRGA